MYVPYSLYQKCIDVHLQCTCVHVESRHLDVYITCTQTLWMYITLTQCHVDWM